MVSHVARPCELWPSRDTSHNSKRFGTNSYLRRHVLRGHLAAEHSPDASNSRSGRYLKRRTEDDRGSGMARGFLLWLLGVPLSVIILIALFTNYI